MGARKMVLGCNNGIGGSMNILQLLRTQSCQIFYGLKRCASKNAVLRCNKKKWKVWVLSSYTKRQSGGKTPQIRPTPKQNRSESQFSCIFQDPMKRDKHAYMGLWVKYALGKSSCVSKIPPVPPKNTENNRFRVPGLPTLQLTALLLNKFRLRLHCYTLRRKNVEGSARDV